MNKGITSWTEIEAGKRRWWICERTLVCDSAQLASSVQTDRESVAIRLCDALNDCHRLGQALVEIQKMADARKSLIRMPDGRMLDNFCRAALSPILKKAGEA